jgi:hypothetical protein
MAKAILPENQLPNITVFEDGTIGYTVRYRVVSEDINRFSAYSGTFRVRPNYVFERPAGKTLSDVEILTAGPYVNIVWDPIAIKDRVSGSVIRKALEYDIFLQWGKGETNPSPVWIFEERVEGSAQGFVHPTQYELTDGTTVVSKPNRLSVEIYLRSIEPRRDNTPLLVYKLDDITV